MNPGGGLVPIAGFPRGLSNLSVMPHATQQMPLLEFPALLEIAASRQVLESSVLLM